MFRNQSPREGLYNSTRIRVLGIPRTCLQIAIGCGRFDRMIFLPPRVKLTTTDEDLPVILECTHFPVPLCFAMTVNKSRGLSLEQVGVDLHTPPFTHRQLYMPLSRVKLLDGPTLLTSKHSPTYTDNIVYQEVLL